MNSPQRLDTRNSPQTAYRQRFVQCMTASGLHRLAYHEWGDPDNPRVIICAHGLTRAGADFERLAERLARHARVIAPDMPGRGASEWLSNAAEYQIPIYVADCVTLIARLQVERVDWVGTSMGGIIGMALASLPNTPIRRLVLNDVGPVISAVALKRIGEYLGKPQQFVDISQAERFIRGIAAPFGPHSAADWRHLTEVSMKPGPNGGFVLHYDPMIAQAYAATPTGTDIELWPYYDAIRAPTLVTRGALSDLLSHATAVAMQHRGPRAELVEFAGVGHAPTFLQPEQIAPVAEFLLRA